MIISNPADKINNNKIYKIKLHQMIQFKIKFIQNLIKNKFHIFKEMRLNLKII